MRPANDDGFTLVEILVVLSLVGILGAVAFQTGILGLRLTFDIERTVSEAIDAQQVATYFPADVHNTEVVQGTSAGCGAPTDDLTDEAGSWHEGVLLTWDGGNRSAAYVVRPALRPEGPRSLVRTYCESGVVVKTQKVARFLPPVSDDAGELVAFTCRPRPDDCRSLTLTVDGRADRADNRWRYELTAVRRISDAGS